MVYSGGSGEFWENKVGDSEILKDFTAKKPMPEVIDRELIKSLGSKIGRPVYRALYYFIYLTGARISEALLVQRQDIQAATFKGEPIITVRLHTLKKRRGTKFRQIPIWVSKEKNPEEYFMWQFIKPFVHRVSSGFVFALGGSREVVRKRVGMDYYRSIDLTTRAVYRNRFIDKHTFNMYPHYLRHCRLTHMSQVYGFDEIKLMRFAGWSSTKPAVVYIQYNWMSLAEFMVKA